MTASPRHSDQGKKLASTTFSVATTLLAVTLLGCERRGVEEQTIAKGVERVPDAPADSRPTESMPEPGIDSPTEPWTVPEGWTTDPEPRQMRRATYIAPDSGGPVEVAITRFPGRVGGELANVNRWRRQMGLPPIGEGELDSTITRFSSSGYDGYQARIDSSTGVMLAAGVYEEAIDQTWFVRATLSDPAPADRLQQGVFGMARSIAGLE